jgi:hypothetical protein
MELYELFFYVGKDVFIISTFVEEFVEEVREESLVDGDSGADCKDAIDTDRVDSSSVCDT